MKPTTQPTTPGERLAKYLEDEFPEERIARGLSEIATATLTTRAGTTEPDYKTRLAGLQLVLAYKLGRPIERSESVVVTMDADQDKDAARRLRHSPALREAMKRALEEAGGEAIEA